MTAPVTHILPHSNIRRVRMLPSQGRVNAHINQKVRADDVIAEAPRAYRHTLVDIWRALGLVPGETSESSLRCKVGMRVMQGDVIAEIGGVIPRIVRAPVDGEVVAIGGGRIMIQHLTEMQYLMAGIPGLVLELIEDRGAIIEADGALVQGVWGNGRINTGPLVFVAGSPGEPLAAASFNKSAQGAVALGGHCGSADALKKAVEMGLKGLILGSLTADLVPTVAALDFPVILLEGFGRLPINTYAYKILSLHKGEETVLNAEQWDTFAGTRPEVFIPLEGNGQLAAESDEFTPGQLVRLHGAKYETLIGEVSRVDQKMVQFPGGARGLPALIQLETGDQVTYPLMNLDVVE